MGRWKVSLTSRAEQDLKELLHKGDISKADIKVLLRWLDEMEEFGPEFIAKSPEWHDHKLQFEWEGYRSSAFSRAGRVIYKVINIKIVVEVYRITPNHNYKK